MHVLGIVTPSQENKEIFIRRAGLEWGLMRKIGLDHDSLLYIASRDRGKPLQAQHKGQRLIIGGSIYGTDVASFEEPIANLENLDLKLPEGDFWFLRLNSDGSQITIGVDRFGITSVYFMISNKGFIFSTDLHDIVEGPKTLDDIGISFFFIWGYTPPPKTIYKHISLIPAASYITIRLPNSASPRGWHVGEAISPLRRYWLPEKAQQRGTPNQVARRLFTSLQEAIDKRAANMNAVYLSGGLDSTLTLDLLSKVRRPDQIIAITGAVKGVKVHEDDLAAGSKVAQIYGVRHETVVADPRDPKIIKFWQEGCQDWITGTHLGFVLWYAMAHKIGNVVKPSTPVFTAESADTVTEFGFTGFNRTAYLNRFLYSPQMLSVIDHTPLFVKKAVARLSRHSPENANDSLIWDIVKSWLHAIPDRLEYFDGLLFGHAQCPGLQTAAWQQKLAIVRPGFSQLKEWAEQNMTIPYFLHTSPSTLQYNLLLWKLDSFLQGQDVKVVIHSSRHCNLLPQFPFLDTDVINVLATLPPFARRFYKYPKHFIRYMARRYASIPDFVPNRGRMRLRGISHKPPSFEEQDFLTTLLSGPLGEYFHELLEQPAFLDFLDPEAINVPFLQQQLERFQDGKDGVILDLIYKAASLEEFIGSRSGV